MRTFNLRRPTSGSPWSCRGTRSCRPWPPPLVVVPGHCRAAAVACHVLPVVLWLQEALGHMPFPVSTAIHVPSGVGLFGGSIVLALVAGRPSTTAT